MKHTARRFLASRNGTMSLEFAIVGPVFCLLLLGIFMAGLLLWSKAAMQAAASQAARCVALGATDCSDSTAYKAYVSSILNNWGVAGLVSSVSVSVQPDTGCNRTAGHFSSVTITGTGNAGGGYVSSLANVALTATACYPSKA